MNKLTKILGAVLFSVVYTTASFADSSNFAGPYVGVSASMAGVEIAGSHVDNTMTTEKKTSGKTGMTGGFGHVEAGYNLPVTPELFVTIGGSYTPTGDATIQATNVSTSDKKVNLEMSDIMSIFIEPSYVVTPNAAIFAHVGYNEVDIQVKGDDVKNKTTTMDGTTVSVGLKVITDSGIYLKAEGGMTDYDTLKITGITDGDAGSTATATGDVELAFGMLTVGYKF